MRSNFFLQPPDKQLGVIGSFVVPSAIILHYIDRPLQEVMNIAEMFYRFVLVICFSDLCICLHNFNNVQNV